MTSQRSSSTATNENSSKLEQTSILSLDELRVQRQRSLVLDIPHLDVCAGEILAIIGPNGAGKSTLLLTMALLLWPTHGRIRIAGELATQTNALRLRRRIAMVFQEPLLLSTSVFENVATGLKIRGLRRPERERKVMAWLERFGIASLARRPARSLSGGEAQRASLARAFVLEPQILLLDEPFPALDPPSRAAILADLKEVIHETGTTTVIVTHDRDEALALGDRAGVLIDGRFRQVGPVEEVFTSPSDADVAAFVGVETVVAGQIIGQDDGIASVEVGRQSVQAVSDMPVGSRVMLCLRPEDVTLLKTGEEEALSSARNRVRGIINRITPLGAQVRVVVDCGFPIVALVTRRSAVDLNLAIGQNVCVSFKASSVHLIDR
jgi:tungstate transport system ATP-binding protein